MSVERARPGWGVFRPTPDATVQRMGVPGAGLSRVDSDAWEEERQERDGDGRDERAAIDAARRGAQLSDEIFVCERLFARVEIARAACGEGNSGLFARLQKSQACHPDGEENDRAHHARRVVDHEQKGRADAHRQGHDAEQTTLALFAWADVGDFGNH